MRGRCKVMRGRCKVSFVSRGPGAHPRGGSLLMVIVRGEHQVPGRRHGYVGVSGTPVVSWAIKKNMYEVNLVMIFDALTRFY